MSSRPSVLLRQLAGATAVSLAFAATGHAAGLVDDVKASLKYTAGLSITLRQAAGNDEAGLRARGFVSELEKTLKDPSNKTRIVDYPKPVSANMLRVLAVVPPQGFEQLAIPVCAERDSKVLGTWSIKPTGDVVPRPWTGSTVSEGNSSACKAFILAAREEINQQLASAQPAPQPAQPPPAAVVSMVTPRPQ